MSGIKTGTPGFVNPVDGKVYTLNPGGPDSPLSAAANPVADLPDSGDMTVDNTVKDISKNTRITLGKYLSEATKGKVSPYVGVPNKYSIDPSTEATPQLSLSNNGYPVPPGPTGNSQKFAGNLPSSISQDYAEAVSISNGVSTLISKGKGPETDTKKLLDGNDLFKAITVDQQKVVVLPGPLANYTKAAIDPNYRTSFVSFADFKTPPKALDNSLIKLPNNFLKKPNEESVISGLLTLNLANAVQAVTSQAVKSVYPVSVPAVANFSLANLISISTADGNNPAPLTVPTNQNAKIFTQNPGSSTSGDFISIKSLIKKGSAADQLPDGHTLLPNAQLASSPVPTYQIEALTPNYRTSFTTEDILNPSPKLTISLLNYKNLELITEPKNKKDPVSSDLSFDLFAAAKKVVHETTKYDDNSQPLPGGSNEYPVSIPKTSADFIAKLWPISLDGGKYTNSLTVIGNDTEQSAFDKNLPSYLSKDAGYINDVFFKKGKQKAPNNQGRNGNSLLKDIVTIDKKLNALNAVAQDYFKKVFQTNFFYPDVSTPSSNITSSDVAFLQKEIEPTSPPPSFFPNINLVKTLGKYYGQPGDAIIKGPVTLAELRNKPVQITRTNEYSISPPPDGVFRDLLSPITNPMTNSPMPLGGFTNSDSYVDRDQIKPLSSDPSISKFSKGKESKETNGNSLLLSVKGNLNTVENGTKTLGGLPTNDGPGIDKNNPLYGYVGSRGAPVLSVGQNRWTAGTSNEIKLVLKDGTEVDQMKMATIGIGLMQRAAFQIPAGTADKFNPVGPEASLGGALLPPLSLVSKVDLAKLEASDVFASLSDDALFKAEALTSIAQFNGQSWGTLYTADQQFEDFTNVGMLLMSYALITAVGVLLANVEIGQKSPKKSLNGQLVKGKHKFTDQNTNTPNGNLFFKVLGLKPTDNDWSESLATGFNSYFFGVDRTKQNIGTGGGNRGVNLLQGVGAGLGSAVNFVTGDSSSTMVNISTCRTIYRSFIVIGQKFASLGNTFQSSPITGFASSFDNIVKIFKTSKLISAINVFSSLGDAVLNLLRGNEITQPDGTPYYTQGGGFESVENIYNVTKEGQTEKVKIKSLQQTITKNRLTYGNKYDPSLSWGAARAPSLYLTDTVVDTLSILDGEGKLNSFKGRFGLSSGTDVNNKHPVFFAGASNGRISNDERIKMEEILDGEYVPFSFHDVRTNEVVSFHAFLTSMTDDYTASYDTTEGFGRVEPVKTYKGTMRRIGLSFYVAATSEQDFDHMWYKINKLTTLVYPQYTSGRDLLPDQFQFKAPFSQLPAASPLIRIRLGDLLRSNYSRFALARLFGAANGDMKIPTSDYEITASALNVAKSEAYNNAYYIKLNEYELKAEPRLKNESVNYETIKDYLDPVFHKGVDSSYTFKIENIKISDRDFYVIKATPPKKINIKLNNIDVPPSAITKQENLKKIISDKILQNLTKDDQLVVKNPAVGLAQEKLNEQVVGIDQDKKFFAALDNFMNPEKNAIVKSFESAGGKGLAGVIESMNFDWYDRVTWSIDPGRTAPKLCKVTLSFSPIHDISPGLDHRGYNRAPIYPVGGGSAPASFKKKQ